MLNIFLKVILIFLSADFLTGVYHFTVDTYGVLNSKFFKNSVDPLLLHHVDPLFITTQSYWQINGGMYVFSFLIFFLSLFFGIQWELWLLLLFCSNGNSIHKWSHAKYENIPKIGRILQKLSLIQTKAHHAKHHMNSFKGNYCVMTNYLNPILSTIKFWELIILSLKTIGLKPVEVYKQLPK